jgi:mono/diheme cytochrome c family protein
MRKGRRSSIGFTAAALVMLCGPVGAAQPTPDGAALYASHCESCHGTSGRGNGPDASLFVAPPRDLREGFLQSYETDELVARIREGVPLMLTFDPKALRARLGEVNDVIAHLERIPDVNWKLVERGEELYVDRCEVCHGPYGRPPEEMLVYPRPAADLSSPAFQRAHRDEDLIRVARRGHESMPAASGVRDDDAARALVAYLRVLSPGFDLYSRYCAACHGDDGRPQREFVAPGRQPKVVFDRAYLESRNPDQLQAAVFHMLGEQKPMMPHFRETLTAPQVRAIVQYLKSRD